jgi:hypothetical protein
MNVVGRERIARRRRVQDRQRGAPASGLAPQHRSFGADAGVERQLLSCGTLALSLGTFTYGQVSSCKHEQHNFLVWRSIRSPFLHCGRLGSSQLIGARPWVNRNNGPFNQLN